MQINRAALIRMARETAEKAALSDPNLVAAYLTGSLRTSDPFIGNATDVDIVFVHPGEPKIQREIIPLTPEIHLDIFHHASVHNLQGDTAVVGVIDFQIAAADVLETTHGTGAQFQGIATGAHPAVLHQNILAGANP